MRFTLVTSAHVANNPRLVKEADALTGAGHLVRVVAPLQHRWLADRDDALMARRGWRLERVDVSRNGSAAGRLRWWTGAVLERLALLGLRAGLRRPTLDERATSRYVRAMLRVASAEPADVVMAHNLAALPVAARAARRLGARLGFDVEDLHTSEVGTGPARELVSDAVHRVEARWLPRCDLLTASSPGIADEIARMYRVPRPRVILNVFSREERELPARTDERVPAGVVSLYWFSQVIAHGRGLEDAVEALRLLPAHVHLFLRGERDPAFASWLEGRSATGELHGRVHLLPTVPPDDLVPLAARYDIGLALEPPVSLNKQLATSNKLLTYLLAGLAVAATDTPGQKGIVEDAAGAGFLYRPGDVAALARGIGELVASPARLAEAKRRAREAADARYCWEIERESLVAYLAGGAAGAAPGAPRALSRA